MNSFQEMLRRASQDAEEGSWAPPPGSHRARVVDTDVRTQRATGTPIVVLELQLLDEPDRGKQWEHPMWFSSDAAAARSWEALSTYGLDRAAFDACTDEDDLGVLLDTLVGVEVEVSTTAKDDGNGVWTNVTSSRGRDPGFPADTGGLDPQGGFADTGEPPPPKRRHDTTDDDVPF